MAVALQRRWFRRVAAEADGKIARAAWQSRAGNRECAVRPVDTGRALDAIRTGSVATGGDGEAVTRRSISKETNNEDMGFGYGRCAGRVDRSDPWRRTQVPAKGSFKKMPALSRRRRGRQDQARAAAQRPRRPQVRHRRGLQLFRRQQELRHHLERGGSSRTTSRTRWPRFPAPRWPSPASRRQRAVADLWAYLKQFGADGKQKK